MNIHSAHPGDFGAVCGFYNTVIDQMDATGYFIAWEKEYHPSDDALKAALANGELYIGTEAGEICAAMVLSEASDEECCLNWRGVAGESLCLQLLAVDLDHSWRGLGGEMVAYAKEIARNQGKKFLRLDVMDSNEPAKKLYLKCEFEYCGSFQTVLGDLGTFTFLCYECTL